MFHKPIQIQMSQDNCNVHDKDVQYNQGSDFRTLVIISDNVNSLDITLIRRWNTTVEWIHCSIRLC